MPTHERQQPTDVVNVLQTGTITVQGLIPWSSNYTFVASIEDPGGEPIAVILKPLQGERPLSDFPPGLYKREAAAFICSDALGWSIVPETIARDDTPLGPASLQRAITDADQEEHYFLFRDDERFHDPLSKIALFDMIINNADRKGGHILRDTNDHLWGIDNGLSFLVEDKLRTVVWDYADEPIPQSWRDEVAEFGKKLPDQLNSLLSPNETAGLRARCQAIAQMETFPAPVSDWQIPWPLV